MQKKILFLAPMNPMGIGGGSFATHAYLRAISEIVDGHIDVVLAEEWKDNWDSNIAIHKKYIAHQRSLLSKVVSYATGHIQRFSVYVSKLIDQHHDEYSTIVSNGSSISGDLISQAKKYDIKIITIHHNYEPEYFIDNSKGLSRWVVLQHVKRLERLAYKNSSFNLFLTKQDLEKFQQVYGLCKGSCAVIGVFEYADYLKPSFKNFGNIKPTIVITGSLCTMQGVDGIKFFFENLYPSLPENVDIVISGRNPTDEVKSLCSRHTNVKLIPNPKDMSEVINNGDIYVCPTRVGGGLKLRIMDGLKLGLPVITHVCSARGYDLMDPDYFKVFSNEEEFRESIQNLMTNKQNFDRDLIIDKYKEYFSYGSGLKRMKRLLRDNF